MKQRIACLLTLCVLNGTTWGKDLPGRNIELRGSFQTSKAGFDSTKTGRVAFMGGSITEMNGYRPMVMKYLTEKYPTTKFDFIDAGISSTCSTTGAFRLSEDVLGDDPNKPVNLFFVEFAVNDDQDAVHSERDCIRGMEGIIRQALTRHPGMDIVLTYFVNPSMLKTIQEGKVPLSIAAHQKVAKHYGISTILLADEVADRIAEGTLSWKEYGGTHPAPAGNAIAATMIESMLEKAWSESSGVIQPHPLPELLDKFSYFRGRFLPENAMALETGWQYYTPEWKSLAGSFRSGFADKKLYCTTTPGKELTIHFDGTALGVYVLAGPDAGELQVSIDDQVPVTVNLYHRFSSGLHYPRTVMFVAELDDGAHVAKVSLKQPANGKTTAARILQFVAN